MMSGSDVMDPWPISVAADMMVMAPSGAILTHGFMIRPARSAATTAASARALMATAKDRPAAPIITWRRETGLAKSMGVFISRLPACAFNRAHDPLVSAATANIGTHVFDDLLACRLRIGFKQIRDRKSTRL